MFVWWAVDGIMQEGTHGEMGHEGGMEEGLGIGAILLNGNRWAMFYEIAGWHSMALPDCTKPRREWAAELHALFDAASLVGWQASMLQCVGCPIAGLHAMAHELRTHMI